MPPLDEDGERHPPTKPQKLKVNELRNHRSLLQRKWWHSSFHFAEILRSKDESDMLVRKRNQQLLREVGARGENMRGLGEESKESPSWEYTESEFTSFDRKVGEVKHANSFSLCLGAWKMKQMEKDKNTLARFKCSWWDLVKRKQNQHLFRQIFLFPCNYQEANEDCTRWITHEIFMSWE